MDKKDLALRAYIFANIALATANALKETLLETQDQESAFKAKLEVYVSSISKDLEAIFGVDSMKDILSTLKERGVL